MTKLLFKKYDTDGSGHLDKDEMKVILDSTFKEMGIEKSHSKEEVDDFFKKADANGDGYIQLLEYVDVVRDSLEKAGLSYEQFEQMAKSGNIKKNWEKWSQKVLKIYGKHQVVIYTRCVYWIFFWYI